MGDKRTSITQTGILGLRAIRLLIVTCTLIAFVSVTCSINENDIESESYLNIMPQNVVFENLDDNSSFNSSLIQFKSQNNITSSPVSIAPGSGYYSSHPISYDSLIGSQTKLVGKDAAITLNQATASAKGISGSAQFMASESSYQHGDSEYIGETKLQMTIDETVTEGSIHIGALQGDAAQGHEPGNGRTEQAKNAWKNPALEVEEDYIGSYHISKNMTINSLETWKLDYDSWIDCCTPAHYAENMLYPRYAAAWLNANEVFGYNFTAKN